MKVAYFDCFSGISGDMTVGALLDAGVDFDKFKELLNKLPMCSEFEIKADKAAVNGITGISFDVKMTGHHEEHHSHGNKHGRKLADILQIISDSCYSGNIAGMSAKIFRTIAEAEGAVHGKPPEDVHFHEVGAVDSIVDIVGTAICLDLLGVEKIYCSALTDGTGFVRCAHGEIPVPVPAVMKLLEGSDMRLNQTAIPTELVTPTGAAIVKTLAGRSDPLPLMRIIKTGYGFGKKDIGRLNALRIVLGETDETAEDENKDTVSVVETNIDDSTGEELSFAMKKLFDAGALDAWFSPVQMKKNRPAWKLSVICRSSDTETIAEAILQHTTAIGIRYYPVQRMKMSRTGKSVNTEFGDAAVKICRYGSIEKIKPEYEDCARLSEACSVPYKTVSRKVEESYYGTKTLL